MVDLSSLERHKSALVLGAVLCGLICGGILIGVLGTEVSPLLVAAAFVVPLGLLALVSRIELGLVAILLSGVFVRVRIPTGTDSEVVVGLVICLGSILLWIGHGLVEEKRLALHPAPINLPVLAFIGTVIVSWFWGRAFRDVLVHEVGHPLVSVAAGVVLMALPACSLLTANSIRNMRWIETLVAVVLTEGLVVLIVDLGSFWRIGLLVAMRSFLNSNGVIQLNAHGLLGLWCVSFAMALAFFARRLHWVMRLALVTYVAGWVYWAFYTRINWLSGWIPIFVALAVIAFLRSKLLFVVLALVVVLGAGGYYWRTEFQAESERSGKTRWAAYQVNWRITGEHLLFGTGPAGYASYYMSYFPMEGMASHSNLIDIVAQTGIVGTASILWFFGAQVLGTYKLWLQLGERRDFAASLSAAVLGGTVGAVVAMALGDWLLPFAYTQGIVGFDLAVFSWLFMGSVWAMRHSLGTQA